MRKLWLLRFAALKSHCFPVMFGVAVKVLIAGSRTESASLETRSASPKCREPAALGRRMSAVFGAEIRSSATPESGLFECRLVSSPCGGSGQAHVMLEWKKVAG
jgi:hypothetical protein